MKFGHFATASRMQGDIRTMARNQPNANTNEGGHQGDAPPDVSNAPPAPAITGFENATNPIPPVEDVKVGDKDLEEGRRKFEAAYIKNHEWEKSPSWKGEPSQEQRQEMQAHPYWQDPTKFVEATEGAKTEPAKK